MDWLHIESWLSSLYEKEGGAPIPTFERTNENYKSLNNLMNLNIHSTKLVENLINHYNLNHAAASLNIIDNNKSISVSSQRALNSLANIAQLLELSTTETTNYYTAISKLSIDQMDLDIQKNYLNEIEYKLDTCQKETDKELLKMKDLLTNLRQQQKSSDQALINQKENVLQIKEKTSEYLLLEEKYHHLEIDKKGWRLNDIHQVDIKANQVENELKELNNTLSSYQVLPSEMVLASIKIQETEEQLRELENEREHLLGNIANRML